MNVRHNRIYIENSVVGGYYDVEFRKPTRKLFDLFREGVYIPVISDHVINELNKGAPEQVKEVLNTIKFESYSITEEMNELKNKYMDNNIVSSNYEDDALHIAIATVVGVDVLVSWNCRHIVNFNKIRKFNAINALLGYNSLDIRTPLEVIENEN